MDPAEIARLHPDAVAFARAIRGAFGDGVRLIHARNREGQELGKDPSPGYGPSPDKGAVARFMEPHTRGQTPLGRRQAEG